MRRGAALLGLSLALSCGAPPPQWPTPLAGGYTIPLFSRVDAPQALLEARINEGPPLLFALSTTPGHGGLTRAALERLGIPIEGADQRATARVERLDIGALTLRGLTLSVIEPLGRIHGRAIDGILGWGLFRERIVEIDPGLGVLRVSTWAPEAPPSAVDLPARWDGGRWRLEARSGRETLTLQIALAAPFSGARGGRPRVEAVGLRAGLVLGEVEGGFGDDGVLNYGAFAPMVLRFDTRAGRIQAWPSRPRPPWRRFEALSPCEEGGCLSGWVERAVVGRVELRLFSEIATPEGYWLRLDLGGGAWPRPLVRLNAKEARVILTDPRLGAGVEALEGRAIEVIDASPLGALCKADACMR